jgi:hypothetical protein
MVFVHSRKDTFNTAKKLYETAQSENQLGIYFSIFFLHTLFLFFLLAYFLSLKCSLSVSILFYYFYSHTIYQACLRQIKTRGSSLLWTMYPNRGTENFNSFSRTDLACTTPACSDQIVISWRNGSLKV